MNRNLSSFKRSGLLWSTSSILGCHPLQQACEQIAEKPPILPDDLVSSIMDLSENQQKQEQTEQGVVLLGAKEES